MWFWLALVALLCWSGSDVFAKLGCQDASDKYSHLKMVMAVGLVMGLHALYQILFGGTVVNMKVLVTYLPVSCLYILSMALGYLGLRYIELSILSPVCNSSGAIVAVLIFATRGIGELPAMALVAVALVGVGLVLLGVVEAREDPELREARQEQSNHRYAKSWIALAIPLLYCLLDALGTFADSIILETLNEDSANAAYELTFLFVGIVSAVYVLLIKKQKLFIKQETPKYIGAVCETAGQLAYVYALADTAHAGLTAPLISAYCAFSVLWSRIFLKERLSKKHYACILTVVVGIVILGVLDL